MRRGDDVDAAYRAFVDRLDRYHTRLRETLERDAPDLADKLTKDPPAPIEYGYQLVPKLRPGKSATRAARPRSISYTWPRTQQIIDGQVTKLARDERALDRIHTRGDAERRTTYDVLIERYPLLERNQRIADQHVKHNRFWQPVIARSPGRFARQTGLHDAVVEREAILAELDDASLATERRAELVAQADQLQTQIRDGQVQPAVPDYVELTDDGAGGRVLREPLYSDITDDTFLAEAERVIEETWTVGEGDRRYALDVELRRIAATELYGADEAPADGTHIDVAEHVKRFPADGGVLTTGSNRTHAIVGRYVSLGPGTVLGNTLAHEFGHILGFTDRYLRGSRDWGDAGYQILEIVPDPDDIMCAPGYGSVLPVHFVQLIGSRP